jgi:hypothetical protein
MSLMRYGRSFLEPILSHGLSSYQLSGLCGVSSQLLDLLQQSWQDVPDLLLYPAFQLK